MMDDLHDPALDISLREVRNALDEATVGKTLHEDFYAHTTALDRLPKVLQDYEQAARGYLPTWEKETVNLVKLGLTKIAVSYLSYEDFDGNPHPRLLRSIRVNMQIGNFNVRARNYSRSKNPPILHRKELFVAEDYPNREVFARLSEQEEAAGLLSGNRIGFQNFWCELLKSRGFRIRNHELVELL